MVRRPLTAMILSFAVQTGLFPLHTAVLLKLETSADKLAYRGANVNVTDKVGVGHLLRITYYDRPDNVRMNERWWTNHHRCSGTTWLQLSFILCYPS